MQGQIVEIIRREPLFEKEAGTVSTKNEQARQNRHLSTPSSITRAWRAKILITREILSYYVRLKCLQQGSYNMEQWGHVQSLLDIDILRPATLPLQYVIATCRLVILSL